MVTILPWVVLVHRDVASRCHWHFITIVVLCHRGSLPALRNHGRPALVGLSSIVALSPNASLATMHDGFVDIGLITFIGRQCAFCDFFVGPSLFLHGLDTAVSTLNRDARLLRTQHDHSIHRLQKIVVTRDRAPCACNRARAQTQSSCSELQMRFQVGWLVSVSLQSFSRVQYVRSSSAARSNQSRQLFERKSER